MNQELSEKGSFLTKLSDLSAHKRQNYCVTLKTSHFDLHVCLTRLPPCDQIVERVNVWCKAVDDPTDGAPKNNSVTHRHPPID
jgi:hypothetical protein